MLTCLLYRWENLFSWVNYDARNFKNCVDVLLACVVMTDTLG